MFVTILFGGLVVDQMRYNLGSTQFLGRDSTKPVVADIHLCY